MAGEHAAGRLADSGLRVAIIERELVGGECSYWGCIPSKTLIRPGDSWRQQGARPGAAEAITGPLDAAAALAQRDYMTSHWPAWHRSVGLDTSVPPEFTHTPGEIIFTLGGSKLVVTTKAAGNSIEVFPVRPGGRPGQPTVTAEPAAVPIGATFNTQRQLAVAEAGPNAVATFTIHRDGRVTPVARAATGQAGTCWISGTGTLLYASNAGSASLSGYRDSGTLSPLGLTSTDPGTVDSAISPDGALLYAQIGGNGIVGEFRINPGGSLSAIGSVTVPGSAGGEGIAAGWVAGTRPASARLPGLMQSPDLTMCGACLTETLRSES